MINGKRDKRSAKYSIRSCCKNFYFSKFIFRVDFKINFTTIRFSYPSEQFELNLTETGWKLDNQDNVNIDSYKIARFANTTQLLLADGFLNDEESKDIDFNQSDALITLVPKSKAPSTITRIRLKQIDENRVAVKSGNIPIIYYISIPKAREILLGKNDFILQE